MKLDQHPSLHSLIPGCIRGNRRAHNEFYRLVFPYAMSIAMRYGNDREESLEILNMSFHKVFLYLKNYDPKLSFQAWIRQIVIHTAIDHYHQNRRFNERILPINEQANYIDTRQESVLEKLNAEQILMHIQSLSPTYRMVFSLHAIEGYTHKEIAIKLGITEGTSKSNYFKARAKLMEALADPQAVSKKAANL